MLLPNDNGEEVIIFISWTLPDSKHRLCQAYYNWLVSSLWKAKESKSAKDGTRNAVWPGWRQALAGKWICNVEDGLLNMFCIGIIHWTKEQRGIGPRDEGEGNSLQAVREVLLEAWVQESKCRSVCCRADTDSSLHQSGLGQEAMLPEVNSSGAPAFLTFACLLTKTGHKITQKVVCMFDYKMKKTVLTFWAQQSKVEYGSVWYCMEV